MKPIFKYTAIAAAMIIVPAFASADNTTSAAQVKVGSSILASQEESTSIEGDYFCEATDYSLCVKDDYTFYMTTPDWMYEGYCEQDGDTYIFYLEDGSVGQATIDGDTITVYGMTFVREE